MKNENLLASARGDVALELAIENIRLVNIFTGEIYPAAIGIAAGKIVHVTQPGETQLEAKMHYDGQRRYAIPGFIDTHVHIESSMLTPAHYADAVLPHGTTTVVTDPHEIANVLGKEAIQYMLEASKHLDLRIMTLLPSCVPAAPGVETSGADFTPELVDELLALPDIYGLAEVMNYHGVIHEQPRMMDILTANEKYGKLVQGHAPRVSGRDLSAYLLAGANSDHECRTGAEAIEKLRSGMIVEIRESSYSFNMAECAKVICDKGYLPNVCFCSDDVGAHDLLIRGHMDYVVRRAIEEGIDPVNAIRYATLNAAQRLKREDLGALAPGRVADIVLLEDLKSIQVQDVLVSGKQVVKDGRLLEKQVSAAISNTDFLRTVHVAEIAETDFCLKVNEINDGRAKVRVIEYEPAPGVPTDFIEAELPVRNGEIIPEEYNGPKGPLCRVAVWHRHGKNKNRNLGLLAGYGVQAGAVATTVAHDSHNLVVLGENVKDMTIAANALRKSQGGFVGVKNGKVIAQLPLPLAGLVSLEPGEKLAAEIRHFIDVVQKEIMPGKNPLHRMIAVTLPVIPKAKITDMGLVDVETQKILPFIIKVW